MPTETALPTALPQTPQTIVDQPTPPSGKTVRLTLTLPLAVVEQYEAQAKGINSTLEKVVADRLRGCIAHTSGRGLYFNDQERGDLERMTGGHIISSTTDALAKIKTTVSVRVGEGIDLELSERILTRAASRAKAFRVTTAVWLKRELVQAAERITGLRPQ